MAEPRITVEMVVADLAAAIDAINEADDRGDDAAGALAYERKEGLAGLLGRLPSEQPEHSLLRARLALEKLTDITDVTLGKNHQNVVCHIESVINESLLTMARAIRPARGTPWWTIICYFLGSLGEDEEPDPLVELVERDRRLAEEFESFDEAADPERYRQLEDELNATTDAIFAATPRSLAGAMAQLKRVRYELDANWQRQDGTHEKVMCNVLAFLGARA